MSTDGRNGCRAVRDVGMLVLAAAGGLAGAGVGPARAQEPPLSAPPHHRPPPRMPAPAGAASAPLVFEDVTVVDVERGALVADQRVVIRGNHIQAVGRPDAVALPPGAHVVAARGQYLIPGLWDLHTHPVQAALSYPLLLASGVTGVRAVWSYIPLDSLRRWQRAILAGQRVGPPRQLVSGAFLRPTELTPAGVAARVAQGTTFLQLYPFTYAAAAAARRVGVPFGGHLSDFEPDVGRSVSLGEAADSGMRIFDHLFRSDGGAVEWAYTCIPSQWSGRSSKVVSEATCGTVAARLRHANAWLVPTLLRGVRVGGRLSGGNPISDLLRPIQARLLQVAGRFWAGAALKSGWLRGLAPAPPASTDPADSLPLFALLQRVDVPILAGTDPNPDPAEEWNWPCGLTLHAELAAYVAGGMSPLAALRTATLNPAEMLNATDSLGTVAPGKLADLVLLDGDPLADITNTTAIRAVVANGRYYDRTALDRLLAEVRTTAKRGFTVWWQDGIHRRTTDPFGTP